MQTAALEQPRSHSMERRRHHRVRVALLGRYMLADHREYACQTTDMSPGGASLVAPVEGAVGERVVLYLEHVGRIEGEITRHTAQGFTVSIAATVTLGHTAGTVVRHFQGGMAVEFLLSLSPDRFDENLVL